MSGDRLDRFHHHGNGHKFTWLRIGRIQRRLKQVAVLLLHGIQETTLLHSRTALLCRYDHVRLRFSLGRNTPNCGYRRQPVIHQSRTLLIGLLAILPILMNQRSTVHSRLSPIPRVNSNRAGIREILRWDLFDFRRDMALSERLFYTICFVYMRNKGGKNTVRSDALLLHCGYRLERKQRLETPTGEESIETTRTKRRTKGHAISFQVQEQNKGKRM